MKSEHAMRTVWVALATGTVSAGVAMLLAPQSGARTQRMVRRSAEDAGHVVRKAYQRVKKSGNAAARTLVYRLRTKLKPRKFLGRLAGNRLYSWS
jgi:gas vesicle protein